MRTLKKTLCLVLAVVMVLGLCAFGVSAEFNDADKIQYSEAADVLNAIGVIKGTGAGDFDPAKELTRAEGATIIARLLGQNSENGTAPFDDCDSVNSWAGFAIDYCAAQGIIAGDGNGHFLPTQPLTGSAFAKMLLTALGYDADIEGLTGASWEVGVAKLVRSINLDDGIDDFDQTKAVDRETAAQLAFTALTETMVYYPSRIDSSDGSINTNLQTTNVGDQAENASDSYKSTSTVAADRLSPYTQLCEKYFPKLKLNVNDSDEDGRLADTWTFKGEKVNTTAKTPAYKVVASSNKTYSKLIEDYNKNLKFPTTGAGATLTVTSRVFLNGDNIGDGTTATSAATTGSGTALAQTASVGDVIELYVNPDDVTEISNVVIIRYRAHDVTGAVVTRTSGSVDQVRVPGVVNTWQSVKDVIGYEGLEKDDIVYYYVADGVYHLFKADSFEGTLTALATGDTAAENKYTISGTKYQINENAGEGGDAGATGTQYNDTYKYYTDDNGFIIWSTLVESGSKDYVMIYDLKYLAASSSSGLGTNGSAEARLVFMDGTTKVVAIDNIDGYKPVDGTTGANVNTVASAAAAAGSFKTGHLAKSTTSVTTDTAIATGMVPGTFYNVLNGTTPTTGTITERYLALDNANIANNRAATRDRLYTYTVSSDGKYTLTDATAQTNVTSDGFGAAAAAVVTNAKSGTLNGTTKSVAVNSDTVFVVINNPGANVNAQTDPKFTVYEGKDKCPEFKTTAPAANITFAYTTERGSATYVVVSYYSGNASGGSYIYLLENESHEQTTKQFDDGGKTSYFVYSAYVETSGEVEDILLTDTADTIVRANGIGLYTAPSYDSHGNYDGMTFANTATTSAAERNQTVALGYRLSGSTLQVNRSYGNAPTWGYAYDCPTSTIAIIKDGDDFSVGTAADLSDDPNDQIYVALTNTNDNKTQIIYVVKRDADETGVAGVNTGFAVTTTASGGATPVAKLDWSTVTYGATPTVTVGGKTYSVDHYATGAGTAHAFINLNSRCSVTTYTIAATNSAAYVAAPLTPLIDTNCLAATNTALITQTASGVDLNMTTGETYILRILAEDGETLRFITVSAD